MKRKDRPDRDWILRTLIGIVMIGATFLIWYSVGQYRQKKAMEAVIDEKRASYESEEETDSPLEDEELQEPDSQLFAENTVVYGGKTWRRNNYIKAILCMGVDRQGSLQEYTLSGDGGQADGVFLLAQDTARGKLKILMIPRDCMTPITITDVSTTEKNGTVLGEAVTHLTLAYSYGDGREKSCEYMMKAVSALLGGLPLDAYLAADTDIIAALNDRVGGVDVVIPTVGMEKTDPAFVFGQTVHLQGSQAERFVRYRDTSVDNSALFRMGQQQEYVTGFFRAVQEKSKTDSRVVEDLFDMAQDNMVTDMAKDQYIKIALDGLQNGLTADDFRMVPGQGITTETYDEFYADQEALIPVILELFYRETD